MNEIEIYIGVTTKAGNAWRPVMARLRRDDVYEILTANPSPAAETWPYEKGDLVRCKPYDLTDSDRVLVAYEKVETVA